VKNKDLSHVDFGRAISDLEAAAFYRGQASGLRQALAVCAGHERRGGPTIPSVKLAIEDLIATSENTEDGILDGKVRKTCDDQGPVDD
jgi:hypothetical protein